jgi:uncharacterized protein (TIGR03437 family)
MNGAENAVSFTLNFDPTLMSFSEALVGLDATEAKLYVNTTRALNGQIGIAMALPAGKFIPQGTARLLTVRFLPVGGSATVTTKISFGDQVLKTEIVDASAAEQSGTTLTEGVVLVTGRAVTSVSAASYAGPRLAAESIVAAFGTELATGSDEARTIPLPTVLLGSSVKVKDSKEVERTAPLFYVSPGQVNYLIPAGTAEGIATVTITSGNGTVSSGLVNIVPTMPSLFSAESNGKGLAAAYALRVKPDGSQMVEFISRIDSATNKTIPIPIDLNSTTDQVYLVLFGTGIRNRTALTDVKVNIGDLDCPVEYAGAQGALVGLDQINVRLRPELKGRGDVNLVLKIDPNTSNVVQINVR